MDAYIGSSAASALRTTVNFSLTIAFLQLSGGEVIYINVGEGPGVVEVLKPAPGTQGFFNMMREAHRTWDGSQPVRRLG